MLHTITDDSRDDSQDRRYASITDDSRFSLPVTDDSRDTKIKVIEEEDVLHTI